MDHLYHLEEVIPHGTPQLPFSIHHTSADKDTINILYLHWHQECEFLFVTEGGAIFHIGNKDYIVKENECLFIPPNSLHSATTLDGLSCSFYAFVFHIDFLTDNSNGSVYNKYIKPLLTGKVVFTEYLSYSEPWQREAITLIKQMLPFYNTDLNVSELFLKSKILELWHLLYTNQEHFIENNKKKTIYNYRLESIFNFIHEHYSESITLSQLATMISISESQFCRSFKAETGMSPFDYIIRYRILRSCTLLSHTEEKIANIANLVGFNNISYFNKEFKKIVGCTPSEYKKQTYKGY